jgi:hypothetical protein
MREQPGGQQEVDPYPRGQQPEPLLDPAGLRQHGIDQIERHISRQLTRVTCVERIGRSPDPAGAEACAMEYWDGNGTSEP